MLKDQITQDLKDAMLSGDKERVEALKMLKTAITYKEVELGARDTGLDDEQVVIVLLKEQKKRSDAATMYEQAGRIEQAAAEKFEYGLISNYLPQQASEEEVLKAIEEAIVAQEGTISMKQMGQIIATVKAKLGQSVDSSRIAAIVKERLT